ncbi:hypothetical protein [Actinoplanes flavus]|uniref:Uncharacterized protein n=1 Tax=Actinoplanes flavus TaxID=2820290 RepID=A0ABS3UT91_9ACTN|nr:hypothetical protein [Actinoplanes flavus]MBO3741797.1 hypothetical protein [Actinoplanes flavus]
MRQRVDWISAPPGDIAVLRPGGDGQESTWLLADTAEGMRFFVPRVWTRIDAVVRTEDGLGRRRTGPWLVYRTPERETWGISLAPGRAGTSSVPQGHVRPPRRLRHDLDRARSLPPEEQLTACDLHRLSIAGDVTWHVLTGDPLLLLVHPAGTSTVAVCSGRALVHWDPTLVPTDAPTSWPPPDDPPQRHAMNELPQTSWQQVEAPRGLGWIRGRPTGPGTGFRGAVRDLETIHDHCTADERGPSWAYPMPHFHTRDGSVVGTPSDARHADEQNLPWRRWERAAQEYGARAVEYWTSHPSSSHL